MDDEEVTEDIYYAPARRHDRWSLVVLGLNYGRSLAIDTANFLAELTIAASQHANQMQYDKRFSEIVRNPDG